MAKIPLRTYTKDVENLIERGEIEQAIAHAKNILKSFPKHIETYRLLGKAYLESQRYSEATDILQRLLSVVPDDFVSQIGMSIIREDEGNLDAAIWHMERAYEVQPFNPAVQDELRRLYGRRDGIEPPKIRLTRGALIRMYARGELYPQAIAETRAVLAEDPGRFDLQVLLARLYYLNGQKVEATEVCSSLIGKLPYCYEANLILSEVLPGTSRGDDARTFQQRLYALDPYAAYLSPNAPTADLVPDQAVTVEQFMFDASSEGDQRPDWTRTVGVEWQETEEEQLPDWLNNLTPQGAPPSPAGTAPAEREPLETPPAVVTPGSENDVVPDWMKEAGWTKTDRSADEIMQEQLRLAGDETGDMAEAAPGEIPDWLQTIAPTLDSDDATSEQDRLDLLESILPESPKNSAAPVQEDDEASLDWLTGAAGAALGATAAGAVDDAAGLFSDEFPQAGQVEPGQTSILPAQDGDEASPGEVPEWLAGLAAGETGQDESESPTVDWLTGAEAGDTVIQAPGITAETPQEEVPDWLRGVSEEETPAETPPAADSADWLSRLGAAEGSLDDELPAEPAADTGTPDAGLPEWMQSFGQEPPVESEAGAEAAWASTAWMTSTEDEQAAADRFLSDLSQAGEDAGTETVVSMPGVPEGGGEDTAPPNGLEAPQTTTFETEASEPQAAGLEVQSGDEFPPAGDIPEVFEQLDETIPLPGSEALPTSETAESEFPDFADSDAAMAWLESLAAKQGADEETLITRPEDRVETPPDWVLEESAAQDVAGEAPSDLPQEASDLELVTGAAEEYNFTGELAVNRLLEGEILPDPGSDDAGAVEAELPDWLVKAAGGLEMEAPETAQPADESALPEAVAPEAEIETPSAKEMWMAFESGEETPEPTAEESLQVLAGEAAGIQPAGEGEPLAADQNDMDAAMAWLESLAARQGADEETLTTSPEERVETPPDWLQQVEASKEITQPVRVKPAGEPPVETGQPAEEGEEFDAVQPDAFAGIDMPADEETAAVEETKIPDWMQGETPVMEDEPEAPVASLEGLLEGYDLPAAEPDAQAAIEQDQQPVAENEPLEPASELTAGETMPDLSSMDVDATMAWLESLAARQGADEETLVTRPEDRLDTPPDWVQAESAGPEKTFDQADSIEQEPAADEYSGELAVSRLLDGDTQPIDEITAAPEAGIAGWPVEESAPQEAVQPPVADETLAAAPDMEEPQTTGVGETAWQPPEAENAGEPTAETGMEPSASTETSGEMDFDATFAWLESLAARQGAEEGSLITDSEARQDETPAWLQSMTGEPDGVTEPGLSMSQETTGLESVQPEAPEGETQGWIESALDDDSLIDQAAPAHIEAIPDAWQPEAPEAETAGVESEALPDWLQQVESDGTPAVEAEAAGEASLEEWLQSLESETAEPPAEFDAEPLAGAISEAWQIEQPAQPVEIDPNLTGHEALTAAQTALNRGHLEPALAAYNHFIDNGEMLDEVIHDLRDALYRFPVDISVWQSLGDAYARNNQLQEALDAYTKAEELLR